IGQKRTCHTNQRPTKRSVPVLLGALNHLRARVGGHRSVSKFERFELECRRPVEGALVHRDHSERHDHGGWEDCERGRLG
ncbi:hypothetical protein, partial [Methylorubrum extorquens]